MDKPVSTIQLAHALRDACVALDQIRRSSHGAGIWPDRVGKHVALAIAAIPEDVLSNWLLSTGLACQAPSMARHAVPQHKAA